MDRNSRLMNLAPGEVLWVSERQLGVLFCGETFAFVLNPNTRAAAERVARWHGCRFQFNPANGSAAFLKLGRVSGLLVAAIEVVALWSCHALSRVQLTLRRLAADRSSPASLAHSRAGR